MKTVLISLLFAAFGKFMFFQGTDNFTFFVKKKLHEKNR